jgi:hypothetical protein
MPFGIRVGTATRVGEEWRLNLSIDTGHIDFVRLVPPPDFARPEDAPPLGGVEDNTEPTLRSVGVELAPVVTTTPVTAPAPAAPVAPRPAAPAAPRPAGQGGAQ